MGGSGGGGGVGGWRMVRWGGGIGREPDLGRKKLIGYIRSRFIEGLRAEVWRSDYLKNKILMNLDRSIHLF